MPDRLEFISKLNRAILHWIKYESACGRSRLLSEASLTVPMGDVLHAIFGKRFHRELSFTLNAEGEKKRGRPTQLDFAITRYTQRDQAEILYAIECKFIKSSSSKIPHAIARDIIRLTGLEPSRGRRRFLVVAGIRRVIKEKLGPLGVGRNGVLPAKNKKPKLVRLRDLTERRRALFLKAIPNVKPPRSFKIERVTLKPAAPQLGEFMSEIYEISRVQGGGIYEA